MIPSIARGRPWRHFVGVALTLAGMLQAGQYVPSTLRPPELQREFRGVWIATVSNIDWPSRAGLTVDRQKKELLALLDRAVQLRLNTVILQVRPAGDAFYASSYEPWSEYLTGRMGRAPQPAFDPLAFAVQEAHRRGLELHAWFNPFRARHRSGTSKVSPRHITRTRPAWVKQYDREYWVNPGVPAAVDYTIKVILDVVRRYDIDGVHLDDYFYPYPKTAPSKKVIPFPDEAEWQGYRRAGGTLDQASWRRQNVDRFVVRLSWAIKSEKRWVKFGISPFGIWRTGHPASVRGLSAVDVLYADARKWMQQGWVDYLSPQLYWPTTAPQQKFGDLLAWWAAQNKRKRHLWPGMSLVDMKTEAPRANREVLRQISLTRRQSGATGNALWRSKTLLDNPNHMAGIIAKHAYQQAVLLPRTPWLDATAPSAPQVETKPWPKGGIHLSWKSTGKETAWQWVLQTRRDNKWTTRILSREKKAFLLGKGALPEVISVRALDRAANLSPPTTLVYSSRR